jgi:hypothetical protein
MKKIIAILMCLAITSPCFAVGREHAPQPQPQPSVSYVQYDAPHHNMHRTSQRTKTLGVVAGIAGVAMLISAITD